MKNKLALLAILAMVFTISACGDDDEESCQKDEICESEITVCCASNSDDDCKYVVDGTEYDTEEEASESIECAAGAAPDGDKSSVRQSLKSMTTRAKANL